MQPSLSPGSKGTTRTKLGLVRSLRRQKAAGKASQQQAEGESCFPQQLGVPQTAPKHTRAAEEGGLCCFPLSKEGRKEQNPISRQLSASHIPTTTFPAARPQPIFRIWPKFGGESPSQETFQTHLDTFLLQGTLPEVPSNTNYSVTLCEKKF